MKKKLLPLAMLAGLNPEPILFGSASQNREPLIYPVRWMEAEGAAEALDFNLYLSPMTNSEANKRAGNHL